MSTIDHVILTRFNLPSGGTEARIRASESWLTNRWELFERYCAPSVAAQTVPSVKWIIYFDPESPEWLKQAVAPYAEQGLFTPIYRAEVPRDLLIADIRSVCGPPSDLLITTNLDNDDGLAIDFAERVAQAAAESTSRHAIFLTHGLIKSTDQVYLRKDADNAFCSVVEPWTEPTTCWSDWHLMLRKSMPVIEVAGAPGWLQVVHGENVSNRVRGRLVSAREWRPLFPAVLDGVIEPGHARVLRDRLVTAPLRWVRDAARAGARRLAVATLGKDRMQRLKAQLSRRG